MSGDQLAIDTRRPRDQSGPTVLMPIPSQMEYASLTSSGMKVPTQSRKQQHHGEHDDSTLRYYSRHPSEERQALSSPIERETFLPTRDEVSERSEGVEPLQAQYDHDELAKYPYTYTPQRDTPRKQQYSPTIPRPHEYHRASSTAPHLVSYYSQSPQNTESRNVHSNTSALRKSTDKSSKTNAKKMTNRISEDEDHKHLQQQDNCSDDGSKKSKRSLFSRASRKLKKKIAKEGSNNEIPPELEVRDDEGSQVIREARDPSPTVGMTFRKGDWVYSSGSSPNPREDYQGLIQTFPSLGEFSSGSTISTAITNQMEDVVFSPRVSQIKSTAAMSPIRERKDNEMLVHKHLEERALSKSQSRKSTLSTSSTSYSSSLNESSLAESNQRTEQGRSVFELESEVDRLRKLLATQEKVAEKDIQRQRELEAYKDECSLYRERLVQKERDNAQMEQALRNERQKVLSLEAENEMLVNVAEEKVGNVITLEKAKTSELKSYKDQCEKYRENIVVLESKVLSMEGTLNATSSIAKTLEEEKKAMSSELSQARTNITTYQSEISEKDAEMNALRSEVSSLKSKCTKLDAALTGAESKAKDDNQSMVVLESENASLLEDLKEKTLLIEKLESSTAQCKQVEDENASLKRRVDELAAKELQMKEELSTSEVFSSNTERLRKMLSDSEAFISSLQSDLSSARTNHHRQLTDVRAKYSSELDEITAKLESAQATKRELEMNNKDLEKKVQTLERKITSVEDERTHQTKAQSEQLFQLMEHADELRKKLSESSQEMTAMKHKLDSNERTIEDLHGELKMLGNQKIALSDNLHALEGELHDLTSQKTTEIEELQRCIDDRNDALANQKSITSSVTKEQSEKIEELSANVNDLKKKLKIVEEENLLHKNQLSTSKKLIKQQACNMKRQFLEAINGLKEDQSSLRSDVQSSLLQEKALFEKSVKVIAFDCRRKLESDQLSKEMVHQASMSSLHSQLKVAEKLLSDERKKTEQLESTLAEVRNKKEAVEATIKAACSKLGGNVREHDLPDAIDDLTLERTQAESSIVTLKIDIKTLKSTVDSLEYDKEVLVEKKQKEINELKRAFNADRKAQDASIESLIASKEEELQSERLAKDDLKKRIEKQSEEVAQLQKRSDICEEELKKCREELTAAKDESSTLSEKLNEATRDHQDKTNKLTAHYMKIEDALRSQLHSVRHEKEQAEETLRMQLDSARREKDTAEKELEAAEKESDRLVGELQSLKQESSRITEEMTDKLNAMSKERDSLQHQEEVLKSTIAAKEREAKKLCKSMDTMKDHLRRSQEEARMSEGSAGKAEQQVSALQEAVSQYSNNIEKLNNEVEELKRVCELERTAHAKALSDQQTSYESELEKMLLALENCKENVEVLTFENNSLEESVVSLTSRIAKIEKTKSKQAEQIVQLKASLNEALEEALRLGSKIDAEELRNVEITQTLSMFQEENNDLKQSLTGIEHDKSSFKERLGKLSDEKINLEQELSVKEKQLFEALKSLTHFELRLAKAEQERDHQERVSGNAHEEVERLQEVVTSLEREKEELVGQISILQQDSNADSLYKDLLNKMKVKDIQHEEEFYDMKATVASLKAKLAAVTQEKNKLEEANNEKINTLQSSLESIKQQLLKRRRCPDDISLTSSKSSKSHLKQTVVELETSVDTIKNHYEKKVRSLQAALDIARKKIEKYERKISDLTNLLEENASVVDVLHKRLKLKSQHKKQQPHRTRSPVTSSKSEESEESEVSS